MELTNEVYMEKVVNLLKPEINESGLKDKMFYLANKLMSEAGETVGEFCKRFYHGKEIPNNTFLLEFGDITWYIYNIVHLLPKASRKEIFKVLDTPGHSLRDKMDLMDVCSKLCIRSSEVGIIAVDLKFDQKKFNNDQTAQLANILMALCANLAALIRSVGFTTEDVLAANLEKLGQRFGGETYSSDFYKPELAS